LHFELLLIVNSIHSSILVASGLRTIGQEM
jgi:hypothetical protein